MAITSDLRFTVRMMLKSPGLTAAGVVALALGIGATTAIFSLADALLFKPLTLPDDRGVMVEMETPPGRPDFPAGMSAANYLDFAAQNRSFEQLAAFEWWGMNITSDGFPESLRALRVSKEFFPMLRANAMLGRTFAVDEDQPGKERVVVLSHALWERRFNKDAHIVGRTIQLDLHGYTVVGVMPKSFEFPAGMELWAPLALNAREKNVRDSRSLIAMGRLRPTVSPGEAQAELKTVAKRLEASYPNTNQGWGLMMMPVRQFMIGTLTDRYIGMLLVAVGFVLLIACANVSNVLFARSMARQKEIALRLALGAGRGRLIRQLLTESLVLSAVGMMAGLALGYWELRLLVTNMPVNVARFIVNWQNISLDWRALLFTAAVATLAGVLSGLIPALRASRPDLNSTLKEGSRGSSQAQSQHRLKSILLVGEIAMSLMLLVGAGLMVRGVGVLHGDTNLYQPEHILTFMVSLPGRYATESQISHFYASVQARLEQIPGARGAALASTLPYSNIMRSQVFTVEGEVRQRGGAAGGLIQNVSPEFFRLLAVPLRAGRFLTERDDENAPKVAVISESVARRSWPGQNPIGRHIRFGDDKQPWLTVVGVVADSRYSWFERGVALVIFVPFAQHAQPFTFIAIRTNDPDRLISTVRASIAKLDPELPISNAQSYEELIDSGMVGLTYMAVMMSVLGIMALALACVGVYGVMAYSVTERTREIGIRMALGARTRDVIGMILKGGAQLTAVGLFIGLLCSVALARLLASLIWGVSAFDVVTFVGVSVALLSVALIASYVPAQRASRVDPLISLRWE